jgi:hypothetical protein
LALENPLAFHVRHIATEVRNGCAIMWTYLRLRRMMKTIWSDPQRLAYRALAITPPDADELNLSLYQETRGTAEAIEKRQQGINRTARMAQARREPEPVAAGEAGG